MTVKVKRILSSWQKCNQVHAELFRSYKSSKNEADGVPDSSMEGQEAIQISVKFGNATKNRNGSAVISGVQQALKSVPPSVVSSVPRSRRERSSDA